MDIEKITNPELVFGLVGPIGVDLEAVTSCLADELDRVSYKTHVIRVTDIMQGVEVGEAVSDTDYESKYRSLINYANAVRARCESNSALVGLVILKIQQLRASQTGKIDEQDLGRAYIIRQFKRPEEIDALRKVYGRKFIQVSVYLSKEQRTDVLKKKIREFDSTPRSDIEYERSAGDLISIDFEEKELEFGQRLSSVFHFGDVFVPGDNYVLISETIERFIQALFGHNKVSPNKDEYGLYIATAASLRSIDLSRQVGAAIFRNSGELLSMGCNEVPKFGGGTYWTEDGESHRDYDEGQDSNHLRKMELLHDLLKRLDKNGYISDSLKSIGDTNAQVMALWENQEFSDALMFDILEFGRMIHAEMSAITDAARLGHSVDKCTLYCTTFPCHMCTKHIVASGITRVVFLEPYPKSYADELHYDSITFRKSEIDKKLLFEPFIGISPRRYRDIFEKGSRLGDDRKLQDWYEGEPVPRIEDRTANYLINESPVMAVALNKLASELITDHDAGENGDS